MAAGLLPLALGVLLASLMPGSASGLRGPAGRGAGRAFIKATAAETPGKQGGGRLGHGAAEGLFPQPPPQG